MSTLGTQPLSRSCLLFLLLAALASGSGACATASDDLSNEIVPGKFDTGDQSGDGTVPTDSVAPADTGTKDGFAAEDAEPAADAGNVKKDVGAIDTGTATADTRPATDGSADVAVDTNLAADTTVVDIGDDAVASDTAVDDAAVAADGAAPLGTVLLLTGADPSFADEAIVALGGTVKAASTSTFGALFDAGGFDMIVVDLPDAGRNTTVEGKLVSWVSGGKRAVISIWNIDLYTSLKTALNITAGRASAPVYVFPITKSATATPNLFAGRNTIPSPISGRADHFYQGCVVTPSAGTVVAHWGTAGTEASLVVVSGGKVVVNGFMPLELELSDNDADSKRDMLELWENELEYLQGQ